MKPSDVIGLRKKSRNLGIVKGALAERNFLSEYLSFDDNKLEGNYSHIPERDELPSEINDRLIVEYCSR